MPREGTMRTDIPFLTMNEISRATSHGFGEIEVIQLRDGRLYRICEEEEATCYYPRRSCDEKARPMRPVRIVDEEII
jgi:hypothetical protein